MVGHRTNIRMYTVVVRLFRCWCAKDVHRSKAYRVTVQQEGSWSQQEGPQVARDEEYVQEVAA